MRLKPSRASVIHGGFESRQLGLAERVRCQGPLIEEFFEAVADGGINDLVHALADLGLPGILDRFHEQGAQGDVLESLPKHVKNLAAVGDPLLLNLV